MPTVCLTDVESDPVHHLHSWRPVLPAGVTMVALMIDPVRGKAVVIADRAGTALVLVAGTSDADMRGKAAMSTISVGERAALDSRLQAAGLVPIPAGVTVLRDVIQHVARQGSPAADLDQVRIPAPPPPPPSGPPPLSAVGPRGALIRMSGGALPPDTYRGIHFTSAPWLAPTGAYTFVDCRMPTINDTNGSVLIPRPGRTVTLDHVDTGALWFEDVGGQGGQTGWTIGWSRLYGGRDRALRPQGAGMIFVSDSWLLADLTPLAGAHTEVMQMRLGAQGLFERVAFSQTPVTNNTVTAVLTIEAVGDGGDTQFIDCEVGYWTGSGWTSGGGAYAVYPGQSQWVRPVIHAPAAAAWYNGVPPRVLIDPVYL